MARLGRSFVGVSTWEYLWRGVLAGSDAELGDDCAGNRTVRERS